MKSVIDIVRISSAQEEPQTGNLREAVNEARMKVQQRIREAVCEWLVYEAGSNRSKCFLDECKGIPNVNLQDVATWLIEEGFRVEIPRFGWGRIVVWLDDVG